MADCLECEPLLNVRQVAAWLQKHPDQIYRMAAKGTLPGAVRIEGTWRFDRRRIEQWLSGEGETRMTEKE